MNITNHRLVECPFVESTNIGGMITPTVIVIHYTAGGKAEGSVSWLCNRDAGVSAHVVIDRDGSITQLVPFNVKAYHAGVSKWKDREMVNGFGIGIEIANWGKLREVNGKLYTGTDREFQGEAIQAAHKNGGAIRWWEKYTEAQIETVSELCSELIGVYPLIEDIVGHDDIAPDRKSDPGPAFPMKQLINKVFC